MIRLEAAGATDVGRRRSHNEDAFHLGDSVFVLADGMGGHRAGEVASAAAVEALKVLDGRVFGTPEDARAALEEAVYAANERVAQMGADDDAYRGMGTTLTVAMGEGRRLHVAHIGDSRAYLLRDGELTQLTADHTLVQHLVDEGQITEEEAAHHPKRSVVTRAIGITDDLEVDLLRLELAVDDVLVLCSDGLTDVVDDLTIESIVRDTDGLQRAVDDLVELANERGGPDNITVVALRATTVESEVGPAEIVGAAGQGDTQPHPPLETPAPVLEPEEEAVAPEPVRRSGLLFALVALAVFLAVVIGGGRWLLGRSWYVGLADAEVAIFQGVPATIGPIELSWVSERTALELEDLPAIEQQRLEDGISATSLEEARRIVERVQLLVDDASARDDLQDQLDRSPAGGGTGSSEP